jgi:tetratricopeptide (TPR) repeat protein
VKKVAFLTLLAASVLAAADEQQAALQRKAKSAFELAVLSAQPQLGETIDCVQAQAALLPVASRDEAPIIYYRKGYCALMAAAVTQNAGGFRDSAAAFDQALTAWPGRVKLVKGKPPEQGPSVLMVLSAIARLEAGVENGARDDMTVGAGRSTCSAELMTAAACQSVFRAGREWLGWIALRHDDLPEAVRDLADLPDSFWAHWVKGKQAFAQGRYRDAAIEYGASLELGRTNQTRWRSNWMLRLGPQPRMGTSLTDLGGAQLLAGEPALAISTLDAAIAAAIDADPQNARAYYLRARARELAGQAEAALTDYNLAARTAYAGAEDLVSGEAHLYRGILLYRRKDFERAEDEFSSALNVDLAPGLRGDAVAWRHMAAVASGACDSSYRLLEGSLASVSPYFPKTEAISLMASCSGTL